MCSNSIGGYVLGVSSGLVTDRGVLTQGGYVRGFMSANRIAYYVVLIVLTLLSDSVTVALTAVTLSRTYVPQERETTCPCFQPLPGEDLSPARKTWSRMPAITHYVSK